MSNRNRKITLFDAYKAGQITTDEYQAEMALVTDRVRRSRKVKR